MRVPIFEARNRLSALLAEVARGVEVTITKRGVPVAKLVPAVPGFDREKARRGTKLGGVRIKDLVDEGRLSFVPEAQPAASAARMASTAMNIARGWPGSSWNWTLRCKPSPQDPPHEVAERGGNTSRP